MHRTCTAATFAVAVSLLLATASSAATFCVTPESSCAPAQTHATLQAAITAATNNGTNDKIVLGAATYTAPSTDGFLYSDGANSLEIAGKGPSTVLTGPTGATHILSMATPNAASSVHDLKVHLPASAGGFAEAVYSVATKLSRISVDADPTQSQPYKGVTLFGPATLDHSTVSVDTSGAVNAIGVLMEDTGAAVTDTTITGRKGLEASGGGTIDRDRIKALDVGVEIGNAPLLMRDTLIDLLLSPGQIQDGITVYDDPSVTIVNCTLLGHGAPSTYALYANANNVDTAVDIANVLIHGFDTTLYRTAGGARQTTITSRNSDYDTSAILASGQGATTDGGGNAYHADPGFIDEAGGDYRLRFDSPLVDAGDSNAGTGSLDLQGYARVVDGDGANGAAPDIGAFEYERQSPEPEIDGPADGVAGAKLEWTGSAQDEDPGETGLLTYGWRIDGGPIEPGAVLDHTFQYGGTYHLQLVVHDPAGADATAEFPVVIDGPAPPAPAGGDTTSTPTGGTGTQGGGGSQGGGSTGGGSARDTRAPRLSRLRVVGRQLRLVLDEAAVVDVRMVRTSGRHRVVRRHVRRAAGAARIALGRLSAGRYRVVVTAIDAAGNRSAARALSFAKRR